MKNKVIRTIISITMALTLAILCMPSSLAAEATGNCGENIIWTFDDVTGTLKISGSGKLELYTLDDEGEIQGENPFEAFYSEIKKVEVAEGVTEIGSYAFANCPNVTNFDLPESIGFISDGAFENCDSLKAIKMPAAEELGWGIFYDCNNLVNVIFAEGTPYIPMGTFRDCVNLGEVYIPMSVKSIDESAFEGCGTIYISYAGSIAQFSESFGDAFKENKNGMTLSENVSPEDIVYNEDGTIRSISVPYDATNSKDDLSETTIIIIIATAAVIFVVTVTVIIIKKKKSSEAKEENEDKNKEYLTY